MRRLAVLAIVVALSGCLEPFAPTIDPAVLKDHPEWKVTQGDVNGTIWEGKVVETRYTFDPDQEPPFPGIVQVFGIRGLRRIPDDDLLARTQAAVERGAEEKGILLDPERSGEGERTTAGGASTQWFVVQGLADQEGGLFGRGETVQILGETWYDGASRTSVVVVAMAQTTQEGFLDLQDVEDLTTWKTIVADRRGTIDRHRGEGLVFNVVSHG